MGPFIWPFSFQNWFRFVRVTPVSISSKAAKRLAIHIVPALAAASGTIMNVKRNCRKYIPCMPVRSQKCVRIYHNVLKINISNYHTTLCSTQFSPGGCRPAAGHGCSVPAGRRPATGRISWLRPAAGQISGQISGRRPAQAAKIPDLPISILQR